MIFKQNAASNVLGLIVAAATAGTVVGCGGDKQPSYGSRTAGSSSMTDASTTPPPVTVPAGALPLATGTYNQIQFKVPNEAGMLYIFDQDTNKVYTTNSVASDGGKSMSMPDLGHTVQGLSTTDQYRVFFAPSQPTTKPIGG